MCNLYEYKLFLKFSSKSIHPNYFFYCFECFHRVCPNLSSAPCIHTVQSPILAGWLKVSNNKKWGESGRWHLLLVLLSCRNEGCSFSALVQLWWMFFYCSRAIVMDVLLLLSYHCDGCSFTALVPLWLMFFYCSRTIVIDVLLLLSYHCDGCTGTFTALVPFVIPWCSFTALVPLWWMFFYCSRTIIIDVLLLLSNHCEGCSFKNKILLLFWLKRFPISAFFSLFKIRIGNVLQTWHLPL